ncbi:hypothetical protein ABK040_014109 [Willaertia magna]
MLLPILNSIDNIKNKEALKKCTASFKKTKDVNEFKQKLQELRVTNYNINNDNTIALAYLKLSEGIIVKSSNIDIYKVWNAHNRYEPLTKPILKKFFTKVKTMKVKFGDDLIPDMQELVDILSYFCKVFYNSKSEFSEYRYVVEGTLISEESVASTSSNTTTEKSKKVRKRRTAEKKDSEKLVMTLKKEIEGDNNVNIIKLKTLFDNVNVLEEIIAKIQIEENSLAPSQVVEQTIIDTIFNELTEIEETRGAITGPHNHKKRVYDYIVPFLRKSAKVTGEKITRGFVVAKNKDDFKYYENGGVDIIVGKKEGDEFKSISLIIEMWRDNSDLLKGFVKLILQMIDYCNHFQKKRVHGAISTGKSWLFFGLNDNKFEFLSQYHFVENGAGNRETDLRQFIANVYGALNVILNSTNANLLN